MEARRRLMMLAMVGLVGPLFGSHPANGMPNEPARLVASDARGADLFGDSVAVDGDTLVIGARGDDVRAGAAYIFELDAGGVWIEVAKLTASDASSDSLFGDAVAIDGDTVVVGAAWHDGGGDRSGAAYVFERDHGGAGQWGEVVRLLASDAAVNDQFGEALALDGDTLVVGAHQDDDAGESSGSVYVFERDQGGVDAWGQAAKLTASDAFAFDDFGQSLALDGDLLAVGAHEDDDVGAGTGSVYVFSRVGSAWLEIRKLIPPDVAGGVGFGFSVGISGDTLLVGAPGDGTACTAAGAAYFFRRDLGGPDQWGFVAKRVPADLVSWDLLGFSAALDGDTALVMARLGDSSGAVYVFQRNQGGADAWGQAARLTAPSPLAEDEFGHAVAIDATSDTILVGARLDDDEAFNAGTAFVYRGSAEVCFEDEFEASSLDSSWALTGVGNANQESIALVDDSGNGVLALTADGATAFAGTDNAGYLYQVVHGDFRAETTVDSTPMTTGNAWRKAGLMVRASLDHLDIRLHAMVAPVQQRLQFVARPTYGALGNVAVTTDVTAAPAGVRFAIERVGQTLTVEYSLDGGATWIRPTTGLGGSIDLPALPDTVLVGLAMVSNNISVTSTAHFDDVSICALP